MNFRGIKAATILAAVLLTAQSNNAGALVAQSASSALHSDTFVGGTNNSAKRESVSHRKKEAFGKGDSYAKTYASKLFQTYSGHITIEQKNIPNKISVTRGSTIQLNLENRPDSTWYVVTDDKVARINSNATNGNMTKIVLEAVGNGTTKLILDNVLAQDDKYKVLTTKRMRLIVVETK